MNTQKKSWLARYWKDLVKVILAIAVVFFAVMGTNFSDQADTPFWWNTWMILGYVCLALCIGLWAYWWSSDRRENTGR